VKYHIHIYRVVGMAECDVEADVPSKAKAQALKALKKTDRADRLFGKSDCKYIAVAFRNKGGGLLGTAERM